MFQRYEVPADRSRDIETVDRWKQLPEAGWEAFHVISGDSGSDVTGPPNRKLLQVTPMWLTGH